MKTDSECLKCGHKWKKRVDNPEACPHCNNKKWNSIALIIRKSKSQPEISPETKPDEKKEEIPRPKFK